MAMDDEYSGYWDALEARRKEQMAKEGALNPANPLAGGPKGRQVLDLAYRTVPLGKNDVGEYQTASDYVNRGASKVGQGIQNIFTTPTGQGAVPAEALGIADIGSGSDILTGMPQGVDISAFGGVGGGVPMTDPTVLLGTGGGGGQMSDLVAPLAQGELSGLLTGQPGAVSVVADPVGAMSAGGGSFTTSAPSLLETGPGAVAGMALPGAEAATMNPLTSGIVPGGVGFLTSGGDATQAATSAGTGIMTSLGNTFGGIGSSLSSGITQLGTMLGGLFMSDKEQKKDKKAQKDKDMVPFLDALKAYEFKYKNPEHGKGQKFGVMAQDLEKSRVGRALVHNTPQGKMVDIGQGVGTSLAALSYLHNRLKKLEGKANGRRT